MLKKKLYVYEAGALFMNKPKLAKMHMMNVRENGEYAQMKGKNVLKISKIIDM